MQSFDRYKPALTYKFVTHLQRTREAAEARRVTGLRTMAEISVRNAEIDRAMEALARCGTQIDEWERGVADELAKLGQAADLGKATEVRDQLFGFQRDLKAQRTRTLAMLDGLARELDQLVELARQLARNG